jgi:AraC family transcriptional regulator
MDVTIETLPARRLATVRHLGPYPQIAEAFHRLGTIAAERGLYAHVDPPMLALYHDDPETTPPIELRSDAALVVRDGVELPSGLSEVTLPAGPYAKASHSGAYSGLGDAWARLMGEWLPRSGFRVGAGPSYDGLRHRSEHHRDRGPRHRPVRPARRRLTSGVDRDGARPVKQPDASSLP